MMAVFHLISLIFIFILSNSQSTNTSDNENEEYPDYTTESYYEDNYNDYGAPIQFANFPKCCPEHQVRLINFQMFDSLRTKKYFYAVLKCVSKTINVGI